MTHPSLIKQLCEEPKAYRGEHINEMFKHTYGQVLFNAHPDLHAQMKKPVVAALGSEVTLQQTAAAAFGYGRELADKFICHASPKDSSKQDNPAFDVINDIGYASCLLHATLAFGAEGWGPGPNGFRLGHNRSDFGIIYEAYKQRISGNGGSKELIRQKFWPLVHTHLKRAPPGGVKRYSP